MKYAQILLATTLTAAAATSFADSKTTDAKTTTAEEKVIVTTQELPESNKIITNDINQLILLLSD